MKENLSIALLNNDHFLENEFEGQLLTKYEKPGSKVDQAKRLECDLRELFFALLIHVGSYEQEESNTKEALQICNVFNSQRVWVPVCKFNI